MIEPTNDVKTNRERGKTIIVSISARNATKTKTSTLNIVLLNLTE